MSLSIGELVGFVDLETGPAESAADKLTGMFEKLPGKWTSILGGGAALAAGVFATSLVGAMNMEPGTDRVAAALDLTAPQAERAGKAAGDLYASAWGESMEDVNAATEAVMSSIKGMRKASEPELEGMVQKALTLASVFDVDVVRASQVAGNMIANGMAKDGAEAFDLLTRTLSKVPVQLRDDILDATDEYGQFFSTLGIDGPQAMGMLAAGAKKGMYGIDKAGDAIKEFTIRSTDMSANTKAAYQAIGLDAHAMANDILAGGDTAHAAFGKIVDGVLAIKDPAKRSNTAISLFGTQMEDLGVKDIPKFLKSLKGGEKGLGNWQGATDRAGKTLNDNARTNITQFGRTVKMWFIDTIGGKVLPKITEWSAALNTNLGPAMHTTIDLLEQVGGWIKRNSDWLVPLVAAIVTYAAVLKVANTVTALYKSAQQAYAFWTYSQAAGTGVLTMAMNALKVAFLTNPIGIIIAGLIALGVGLVLAWKHSETFRAIVTGAFDAVSGAASSVFGWIKRHWPLLLAILTGPFGIAVYMIVKHWDAIKGGASSAVRWVTGKLGDLVGFVQGLPGKIGKAAGGMFDGIKDAFRSALNWIIRAWNGLDFTLPKVDTHIPGVGKVGGFTLGTPNIPELATGGRVARDSIVRIGEREPETVLRDRDILKLLTKARDAGASQDRRGPVIDHATFTQADPNVVAEQLYWLTQTRG
jgi:hypothetical protein